MDINVRHVVMFFLGLFIAITSLVYLSRLARRGNQQAQDILRSSLWGAAAIAVAWIIGNIFWLLLPLAWGFAFYYFASMIIPQAGPHAWALIATLAGLLFAGWVASGRK